MSPRDNSVFQVANMCFPRRKEPSMRLLNTLLDGELVVEKYQGHQIINFLIYDVISYEGQDTFGCVFSIRLQCIRKEIIEPRLKIPKDKEPFHVKAKDFWDIKEAKKILSDAFTKQLTHEVDGLIFQPSHDPYKPGRCRDVLKWKPPALNTVDFLLKIVTMERPGCLKEKKGYLYVGGLDSNFAEIKVTKDLLQYDNKIVECSFDFEAKSWKLLRQRTDKSFPNAYETAYNVCQTLQDPIHKPELMEFIENNRFEPKPTSSTSTNNMPPPKQPLPPTADVVKS